MRIKIPFTKKYIEICIYKGGMLDNGNGRTYSVLQISFGTIHGTGYDGTRSL